MNEKPRLLVLASTYPRWKGDHEPGFVHELSRRLVDRFDVTVLCPHAEGAAQSEDLDGVRVLRYRYAPASLETLVNNGGIVANLRRRRWTAFLVPGFLLSQALAIWRLSREFRPHVIHAHWLIPQGVLVAFLAAIGLRIPPFVLTSHGADLFSLQMAPFPALKRFVLRHAAAVTVVSEGMRDGIARLGVDTTRVDIAPMGVDLVGRFTPGDKTRRSSDEILFVGRLVEKKGLRVLLDAMPSILRERPSATLTVVGFGPELEERQRQASRLGVSGSIRFVGAVAQEQLPAIYRQAALFVAPFVEARDGDQEGLGLVTIEAIGCGCPVVISALPATNHLLALPTVKGVASGNSEALAQAVLASLSMPASTADREASRSACMEAMDWQGVAARYASILKGVVVSGRTSTQLAGAADETE